MSSLIQFLWLLIACPFCLGAFESRPVTPFPVVGYREISVYDDIRKRDLKMLMWYPVEPDAKGTVSASPWDIFHISSAEPRPGKHPVIVISHGHSGVPNSLSWLILGLVHHDFIVIATQHRDQIHGVNHWMRAGDVSILLNKFLASPLSAFADSAKIGIAGFSLGGTTALWIAGGRSTKLNRLNPGPDYAAPRDFVHVEEAAKRLDKEWMVKDWSDGRVKAAFLMAPSWSWLFDEASLRKVNIPIYIMAGAGDDVVISRNNAGVLARTIPGAIYEEIPGKVGHFVFLTGLDNVQRKKVDPEGQYSYKFEDDSSVDRGWIQQQAVEEAVNFFKATL